MKMQLSGVSMVAVALASMAVLPACDNAVDNGTEGLPLQEQTELFDAPQTPAAGDGTKACATPRADLIQNVSLGTGSWGSWQACYSFCPFGSYAYTAQLRTEAAQGAGDDTAMNGIRFDCYDKVSAVYTGTISSHAGFWGSWGSRAVTNPYLTGNPWVSGKMKIEAPVTGDDTAANQVTLKAASGLWSTPTANTGWGTWGSERSCPAGSAFCGVNTRVEGQQGTGDDTALNGVAIACCAFTP